MPIPLNKSVDCSNQVILLTGATSGIGRELSFQLCVRKAQLILLGRNSSKLEALWQELQDFAKQRGVKTARVQLHTMNLFGANEQDFADLAKAIEEQYGRLDGLIHNAALLGNLTPLKLYSQIHWYQIMQTNLNAPFLLTQACYTLLEKSQQARVVFTSTGVAQKHYAYWGAYAISKSASDFMMQQFAIDEVKNNISFCSFNPGAVATPMRASAFPGENPQAITQVSQITDYYLSLLTAPRSQINGRVLQKTDFEC